MKPILFITKMDGGGMETFCLELLRAWQAQGQRATVYLSYSGGVREKELPEGVERVCWDVRAKKSFFRLAKWLRTRPDDPCLCLSQELAVVLVILKRLRLIRNRIYFRESTDVERHYDAHYWQIMRHILPHCDGLIAQSQAGLDATRRLCRRALPRACIVRNLMALPECPKTGRHCFAAEETAALSPRLVCPASFKPMKGQLHLLHACIGSPSFLPEGSHLAFIGDGTMRPDCERFVQAHGLADRVTFRDWTADRDSLYADADCVVIPSDYEGLPNVMLEAILRGTRVSVRPSCAGACELLAELGLPETWPASAALAIPPEAWQTARERLVTVCDPFRVGSQIREFMQKPTK